MHNNYYFLRRLAPRLQEVLRNANLHDCFTQHKDELIFSFITGAGDTFYIRAYLQSDFCCISFPESFHRARKNSVGIFPELNGEQVEAVESFIEDRGLVIRFSGGFEVLFKLHGNFSNLVLRQNGEFLSMFRNQFDKDRDFEPRSERHEHTIESFEKNEAKVETEYPALGPVVRDYLNLEKFEEKNIPDKWDLLQATITGMGSAPFMIRRHKGRLILSLLPVGEHVEEYADPVVAISRFFQLYLSELLLVKERTKITGELRKRIKRIRSYLQKNTKKLEEINSAVSNQTIGDLIMANLHLIRPGDTEVELDDFQGTGKVLIRLKKDLSPQKNAENYYRKGKNLNKETDQLQKSISTGEAQLSELEKHLNALEEISELRSLRKYLKEHNLGKSTERDDQQKPFKVYDYDGFEILVGRNAKNNDLLTQEYAWKDDLWLHARDVAGSHVVIKYRSDRKFPKTVIEKAAELAAYYSRRKTDSVCPVIYTPRKFVRKRKGDPPGSFVVEKEEVILVKPGDW